MDVINEPDHRNCDNCWFNFFNTHPALIDTVNEAWKEHGKAFIIRMRGKKFAQQFGRFMKTVIEMAAEGKVIRENNNGNAGGFGVGGTERTDGSYIGATYEEAGTAQATDQGGKAEGSEFARQVDEQSGRDGSASDDGQASR
jgi:hypothetical protein